MIIMHGVLIFILSPLAAIVIQPYSFMLHRSGTRSRSLAHLNFNIIEPETLHTVPMFEKLAAQLHRAAFVHLAPNNQYCIRTETFANFSLSWDPDLRGPDKEDE